MGRTNDARFWAVLIGLAVLALVPLMGEDYYTRLFTRIVIYGLAAVALDLVLGYGGLVSFGHAAFFGVGAYAVGILSVHGVSSAWLSWPAAVMLAALAALFIGTFSLQTRGTYFIMITLAFAQMLYFFGVSLEAYGGDDGMSLPGRNHFGGLIDAGDPASYHYLVLAILLVVLWLGRRLVRSEFGLALRGIRDDEARMQSLGFPTFRYKLVAFTISGGVCGLAGAMIANLDTFISPSLGHWLVSGNLFIMVVFGGIGTLFGPVFGAAVVILLEEVLSGFTEHWMIVFGPMLLVIMLFARGGLFGWFGRGRVRV